MTTHPHRWDKPLPHAAVCLRCGTTRTVERRNGEPGRVLYHHPQHGKAETPIKSRVPWGCENPKSLSAVAERADRLWAMVKGGKEYSLAAAAEAMGCTEELVRSAAQRLQRLGYKITTKGGVVRRPTSEDRRVCYGGQQIVKDRAACGCKRREVCASCGKETLYDRDWHRPGCPEGVE